MDALPFFMFRSGVSMTHQASSRQQNQLKMNVAEAALAYLDDHALIGVGSGSTVQYFIEALSRVAHRIDGCVAASCTTAACLKRYGIPVIDLSIAEPLGLYVDGADEVTSRREMIKGGGGALTREKIIATSARTFLCLVDQSKLVTHLGHFPVAVEVVPLARSLVGRALVQLGGDPIYREHFVTDNGNIILDVHHLDLSEPWAMERAINELPGVVENGIFAKRLADRVLVASEKGVAVL